MKTLLQHLGLRSNCCNAVISAWDKNKYYCSACNNVLYKQSAIQNPAAKQPVKQPRHATV